MLELAKQQNKQNAEAEKETEMKKYYDAVIVGCGVAGCFTALHLPQKPIF